MKQKDALVIIETKYILGVDGGGTKTEAIAYALDGSEIERGYAGLGNILIDKDLALNNIQLSISECTKRLSLDNCVYMCLGLAGCEAGENKTIIRRFLKDKFNCPIRVINDGELALSALLKGNDGIITISGTGSITIGKNNGSSVRVGGWGHLIGDQGSGYFIAMEAIRSVFLENDLGLVDSILTKEIFKSTNCENREELLQFVYNANKGEIASLVPIILKICESGDNLCTQLLKNAGVDLAQNTIRAIKLLGIKGEIPLAIKGSVITKIQIVKDEFINALRINNIENKLYDEDVSSAKGAYYLGIKEVK
jgi:N-acetylglucosamine kinase-like BadF-type ATPase